MICFGPARSLLRPGIDDNMHRLKNEYCFCLRNIAHEKNGNGLKACYECGVNSGSLTLLTFRCKVFACF